MGARSAGRRCGFAGAVVATAAVAIAVAPGGAGAARAARPARTTPPTILTVPSITGTARSGSVLTATGARWEGSPTLWPVYRWLRCDDAERSSCHLISGARGTSYTASDADVGTRLRVWLALTSSASRSRDDAVSNPSAAVAAKPAPAPVAVGPLQGATKRQLGMLRPFPVVRVHGWLTRSGARLTMLTVRAPRGARVSIRCAGRSCPRPSWARTAALMHITSLQRRLRAGTRIVVTVTKPGFIGKRTVLLIHRGKAPTRVDRCLYPRSPKVRRCPSR